MTKDVSEIKYSKSIDDTKRFKEYYTMRNDIDKLCMGKWKCGIYWSKQENGNCVWSIRHENQDYKLKLEIVNHSEVV